MGSSLSLALPFKTLFKLLKGVDNLRFEPTDYKYLQVKTPDQCSLDYAFTCKYIVSCFT